MNDILANRLNCYYNQLLNSCQINRTTACKMFAEYINTSISKRYFPLLSKFNCDCRIINAQFSALTNASIYYLLNSFKQRPFNQLLRKISCTSLNFDKQTFSLFYRVFNQMLQNTNISKELIYKVTLIKENEFYSYLFTYLFKNNLVLNLYQFVLENCSKYELFQQYIDTSILSRLINLNLDGCTQMDISKIAFINRNNQLSLDNNKLMNILTKRPIKNDWPFLQKVIDNLSLTEENYKIIQRNINAAEARHALKFLIKKGIS